MKPLILQTQPWNIHSFLKKFHQKKDQVIYDIIFQNRNKNHAFYIFFFLNSNNKFLYTSLAYLPLTHASFLSFLYYFFLNSLLSVTNLQILGAFCLSLPDALLNVLLMTLFLTKTISSVFFKLNNLLILFTFLGPSLLGLALSVKSGMSFSPFLTMASEITLMSLPTIHPLTLFLFLSPVLLGLYDLAPFAINSLTLPFTNTPYFIENPCLSFPPVIFKMYPLNSSPS